jgi:hypothetical protein
MSQDSDLLNQGKKMMKNDEDTLEYINVTDTILPIPEAF